MQEKSVGRDKMEVAQILKDHGALVRGGPEQGQKLMEALVVCKSLILMSMSHVFHDANDPVCLQNLMF